MTRNEYLIKLASDLQALEGDKDALFPEIKRVVAFYQEMLDDMIEDGKSEEDAVAAMEEIPAIVERVRSEFAVPAAPDVELKLPPVAESAKTEAPKAAGTDEEDEKVSGKQMGKYTRMTRVYAAAAFQSITVQDQNTAIRIIKGSQLKIEYCDGPDGHYQVDVSDGKIEARFISSMRWLSGLFGNRVGVDKDFVITVPGEWNGGITVHTSNGGLEISDMQLEYIEASTSNGKIIAQNVTAEDLNIRSSNGSIKISGINAKNVDATTSNARITSERITADYVSLITTNGANEAHSIAGETLRMETRNGALSFERIFGKDITLATSNGAVKGSIVGEMADFAITSRTSNGSSNLPPASEGPNKLDVHTSNGRINVEFIR